MILQSIAIKDFRTRSGYTCHLNVSFQVFGPLLGTAPVVLVNHALSGNSSVTGVQGWWNELIGSGKVIDTLCYTVLAIDIPGNGYDGKEEHLIYNYKAFHNSDIARIQYEVIEHLEISSLFAVIGGSLGGQIAWELVTQYPKLVKHLIPIASDWKATDWLMACCEIQDRILNHSLHPIEDARIHAMTFYRTAASFKKKFNRTFNTTQKRYNIDSWLIYHGDRLQSRFSLATYKLMNHLLKSADCTRGTRNLIQALETTTTSIHLIAIDSDQLFLANEIQETYGLLKQHHIAATYGEITSIDGHDAFLIEFEQLEQLLKPIFKKELCLQY